MNSNQNENARTTTTEDTRKKTNNAANAINAFFNNKTKMQRQEAIEDKRQLHGRKRIQFVTRMKLQQKTPKES